jgi:thiol-disulfide isomerase/thioredoxin
MIKSRSIGFVAAALLAAGTTAVACFGEALGRVAGKPFEVAGATLPVDMPAVGDGLLEVLQSGAWLGPGHQAPSLRGKVVVVNFWTYSCINSLRALPYLRAWSQRYGDKGLVVLGVHAPEFGFEKDAGNFRQALGLLDIEYPTVQDNDFATWRRFGNEGWPGFAFVDANGEVRGYRLGEGKYAEDEQLIRQLLAEAGNDVSRTPVSPVASGGAEAQADWDDLRSPESYLGYEKARNFVSPGGLIDDTSRLYTASTLLRLNTWDLAGLWTVTSEFATLDRAAGSISYRFHARDAHIVLGGASDGHPVRFRVTIDGAAPGSSHGVDVDADGWGEVNEDRLYQLVRQSGDVREHAATIEFSRPGVRAYVFTFG